jgi:hypothetical protein
LGIVIGLEPVNSLYLASYETVKDVAGAISKKIKHIKDVQRVLIHSSDLVGMLVQEWVLRRSKSEVVMVVPYLEEISILPDVYKDLYVQSLRNSKVVYADEVYKDCIKSPITQYSQEKKLLSRKYILDNSTDLILVKGWWAADESFRNSGKNILLEVDSRRPFDWRP